MNDDFDVPDPADLADEYEEKETVNVRAAQIHLADNHPDGPYRINSAAHELYAVTEDLDHYRIEVQGLAMRIEMDDIIMLQFEEPMADPTLPMWEDMEDEAPDGKITLFTDAITAIEEFDVEVEM